MISCSFLSQRWRMRQSSESFHFPVKKTWTAVDADLDSALRKLA